jgi:hypothetical protein
MPKRTTFGGTAAFFSRQNTPGLWLVAQAALELKATVVGSVGMR